MSSDDKPTATTDWVTRIMDDAKGTPGNLGAFRTAILSLAESHDRLMASFLKLKGKEHPHDVDAQEAVRK